MGMDMISTRLSQRAIRSGTEIGRGSGNPERGESSDNKTRKKRDAALSY